MTDTGKERREHIRRLDDLKQGHERLDTMVRGHRGDDGLAAEVRALRESQRRREKVEGAVLVSVLALVVKAVFELF